MPDLMPSPIPIPASSSALVKRPVAKPPVSYGFKVFTPIHQWVLDLGRLQSGLLAFCLGALCVLGFAPFHITPVLVVSFTGLVWILDKGRTRTRWGRSMFYRMWAFGVGYVLTAMHWTAAPFLVSPEQHIWFIWLPLIVLPAGMSLIWGVFGIIAGHFWSSSPSRAFLFALVFAVAEYVRGVLFGGFPWNLLGVTWVPGGAMSQLASIGGIYWLTLITIFLMCAPAALTDLRPKVKDEWRWIPAIFAVGIASSAALWGHLRLSEETVFREISVTVMDAGVPQQERTAANALAIKETYFDLLRQEGAQSDIIIWPEAALYEPILSTPGTLEEIAIRLQDRVLITGSIYVRPRPENKVEYYNSLLVIDESGRRSNFLARYNKYRLVPFGELAPADFLPFGEYFANLLPPAMSRMAKSGFSTDGEPRIIHPTTERKGFPPFVPLICYEALFPELALAAQKDYRADWIVNISADGWFGGWLGPEQHYAQNRYRAIESGLPLARAASNGNLGITDGNGRETGGQLTTVSSSIGWTPTLVRHFLAKPTSDTIFINLGMGVFWLTIFLFSIFTFITWRR